MIEYTIFYKQLSNCYIVVQSWYMSSGCTKKLTPCSLKEPISCLMNSNTLWFIWPIYWNMHKCTIVYRVWLASVLHKHTWWKLGLLMIVWAIKLVHCTLGWISQVFWGKPLVAHKWTMIQSTQSREEWVLCKSCKKGIRCISGINRVMQVERELHDVQQKGTKFLGHLMY